MPPTHSHAGRKPESFLLAFVVQMSIEVKSQEASYIEDEKSKALRLYVSKYKLIDYG
jgi:hypothetical protein